MYLFHLLQYGVEFFFFEFFYQPLVNLRGKDRSMIRSVFFDRLVIRFFRIVFVLVDLLFFKKLAISVSRIADFRVFSKLNLTVTSVHCPRVLSS